jgi:hypothetical protein
MTANRHILNYKIAGVIETYAKEQNIPIREAMALLYHSLLYYEIVNGISDMHCRSNEYLAEELNKSSRRTP